MENWPQISILLITYKRYELALRTIKGVCQHLHYLGPLHWHIADDGSGGGHVLALQYVLKEYAPASTVTISDAHRAGVGRSMNLGIHACLEHSDYWLHLEDDWELRQPFDLHPCIMLLRDCPGYGMVRLGYLQAGMQAETFGCGPHLWWHLRRDSSDGFVFAGHASLRHRRFHDAYGAYAEGLAPGDTEAEYAARFLRTAGPEVAWPAWVGCWGPFAHIGAESLAGLQPGTEWQGQETRQTPTAGIGRHGG